MHALTASSATPDPQADAGVRERTSTRDPHGNARALVPAAMGVALPVAGSAPASALLSRRQQEILRAACEGVSDKVIAAELGVSPRTLEGHWRAIHHKLGTTNRCQAGFLFAAMRESPCGNTPA